MVNLPLRCHNQSRNAEARNSLTQSQIHRAWNGPKGLFIRCDNDCDKTVSHVHTFIDIRPTPSGMKSLSLSHCVNTLTGNNVTYYLHWSQSQSLSYHVNGPLYTCWHGPPNHHNTGGCALCQKKLTLLQSVALHVNGPYDSVFSICLPAAQPLIVDSRRVFSLDFCLYFSRLLKPRNVCIYIASNVTNGFNGNKWLCSHLNFAFSGTGKQRSKQNANVHVTCECTLKGNESNWTH